MATTHTSVMDKPMSVQQIVVKADDSFYDDWYPPKNWFRTAETVFKQGNVYMKEGNLQVAYFLLYRHAKLILDLLPKHAQAKEPQYKQTWEIANRDAQQSVERLEKLKPRINKRYERYLLQRREAREQEKASGQQKTPNEQRFQTIDDGSSRGLDPSKDAELGIRMANARTSIRNRHHAPSLAVDSSRDGEDLGSMMRNARRQVDQNTVTFPKANYHAASLNVHPSSYQYPNVKRNSQPHDNRKPYARPPSSSRPSDRHTDDRPAPPIPPKRLENTALTSPPPIPNKSPTVPPKGPVLPPKTPTTPPSQSPTLPTYRPSSPTAPLEQFKAISTLESGEPLRTIFLPRDLRHTFLKHAAKNTSRNLETLGLLCGHLMRNALFITALLFPPQNSTSDTCEMTDEGEVMLDEFISSHSAPDPIPDQDDTPNGEARQRAEDEGMAGGDMFILGWIHTHPTQTCFLSSRDLHTHVGYQSGLPESIAIVCAPSKSPGLGSEWNAFRMTDPPGLSLVRTCSKPGIFHPHPDVPGGIYTDAVGRPGHVVEVGGLEFEVVDLRDVEP